MANIPVQRLTPNDLMNIAKFRCVHGHNGFSHYNCYLNENSIKEKVGFIDIETSNLKANFGIMLSYCIKPEGSNKILKGVISKKDLSNSVMDKRLIEQCVADMCAFDRLVGHYASKFDIPFIRSRAIINKVKFPAYGSIKLSDTWRMAKDTLALHSNRQDAIGEAFYGGSIKTRIKPMHWIKGLQGDTKALEYILDHNIKDVIELEKNYNILKEFVQKSRRSI